MWGELCINHSSARMFSCPIGESPYNVGPLLQQEVPDQRLDRRTVRTIQQLRPGPGPIERLALLRLRCRLHVATQRCSLERVLAGDEQLRRCYLRYVGAE